MNNEERASLVSYRLQRAIETLHEADVNVQHLFWNTAANRLYYACFYALSALLLQKGHITQTHKGVKTLFPSTL